MISQSLSKNMILIPLLHREASVCCMQCSIDVWSPLTCFISELGKYKAGDRHATIGYAHDEIQVTQFEVLIGSHQAVRWVPAKGKLELSELGGARPVEGGREGNGTPLFVARGKYKGNVIPGKASSTLSGAFVPYDDDEKEIKVREWHYHHL